MEELKSCPCCGGIAHLYERYFNDTEIKYIVKCTRCDLKTKYYDDVDTAANAWNRRTNEQ